MLADVFEIRDKDLSGRIGILRTKSGSVETPAFFPVVNPVRQGKEFPAKLIHELGFRSIITNAYLIRKHFGDRISGIEDLRKQLGFPGVIATDSGAFQLMRYGDIDVGNREIVEYQLKIGSDIAVILDIPTKSDVSYNEALRSVDVTLARAMEVIDIIKDSNTVWILPIQGGVYGDLVRKAALRSREIEGFKMYGIGSPVTFLEEYRYSDVIDIIFNAKSNLPYDYPVHLFGAGHPMFFSLAVALGVDTFDSASYILYARDYRYITEYGTERIQDLEVFPCSCPICSRYDPRDILELDRGQAVRLIAYHNLYAILEEIKRIKTAIREGRLWEYIVERSYSHPSLRKALLKFKYYSKWIEKVSPFSKGRRGMLISDPLNLYRPQIQRASIKALNYIKYILDHSDCRTIYLIPGDPGDKPFSSSHIFRELVRRNDNLDYRCVFFYSPIIGLVPYGVDVTYPYAHYEYGLDELDVIVKDLVRKAMSLVRYSIKIYRSPKIVVYTYSRYRWSILFARLIARKITKLGQNISLSIEPI